MQTSYAVFLNELGNTIRMEAVQSDEGITVKASGPNSEVDHTWTLKEAAELYTLLGSFRDVKEKSRTIK